MARPVLLALIALLSCQSIPAQLIYPKDDIYSPYVFENAQAIARKERILKQANDLKLLSGAIDSASAAQIESGLWATSQFMVSTPQSDSGISILLGKYDSLNPGIQRALLEVVYGLYPAEFLPQVFSIMGNSRQAKNFAICAAYVYRAQPTAANLKLIGRMAARWQGIGSGGLIVRMLLQMLADTQRKSGSLPALDSLLLHQRVHGFKMVYSFQRKNRDFPGIAIVQNADGSLLADSSGHLRSFVQLARSASNLPWFITNGSTPQGLYTITGTDISSNVFIGPTPNLQLAMMGEVNAPVFTHYFPPVFNAPPEQLYKSYFPKCWQNQPAMMQAYQAGKIGRSEIIAHGTTISPEWFAGQPFYPVSPTLGCLCGREIWDGTTGKIAQSDQLDLVNAFLETPGTKGFLMVVELDDKQAPVTRGELERLLGNYMAIR